MLRRIEDNLRFWPPKELQILEPLSDFGLPQFQVDTRALRSSRILQPIESKLRALSTLITEYNDALDRTCTEDLFREGGIEERAGHWNDEVDATTLLDKVKTAYDEVRSEHKTADKALGKHTSDEGVRHAKHALTDYSKHIGPAIKRAKKNHMRRYNWMKAVDQKLTPLNNQAFRARVTRWTGSVDSSDVPEAAPSLTPLASLHGSQESAPSRPPSPYDYPAPQPSSYAYPAPQPSPYAYPAPQPSPYAYQAPQSSPYAPPLLGQPPGWASTPGPSLHPSQHQWHGLGPPPQGQQQGQQQDPRTWKPSW